MEKLLKYSFVLLYIFHCASATFRFRTAEEIAYHEHMLKQSDAITDLFISEYENYTRSGVLTSTLDGMFKMMQVPFEFAYTDTVDLEPQPAIMTCLACRTSVSLILRQYRSGARNREQIIQDAVALCRQFTSYTVAVCEGSIRKNADVVLFIIDNRPALTANQMCNMILHPACGDPDPAFDFRINVSQGPAITGPKAVFSPRNTNELKILHFTDTHDDPHYLIGANRRCPDPVCCRRENGNPSSPQDRAGRWGEPGCGTPFEVIENTLRSAHAQHPDAHMIYVTGDYINHAHWTRTQAENIQIFDRLYNMLKTVFGNKPVFVSLGNHEANPTNQFAPTHITAPNLSTNWLYNHAANGWSRWLPTSTQATIRRGGYYTALSPDSKLRIIALNNNDCNPGSFWIFYSTTQIAEQLQWFHDTLLSAERAGEHVHVLAHMHSGTGACYRWWSREYRRIIDRFHRIIGAQFGGHSHGDEMVIYYARDQHRIPINAGWMGGAVQPGHPNYIVYQVDRKYFQVVDKESWFYIPSEANLNPSTPPVWRRQYQFAQHFGLPNMSPAALDNFVSTRMSRSRQLLLNYQRILSTNPNLSFQQCDEACLRRSLCQITVNEMGDTRKCDEIRSFPLT